MARPTSPSATWQLRDRSTRGWRSGSGGEGLVLLLVSVFVLVSVSSRVIRTKTKTETKTDIVLRLDLPLALDDRRVAINRDVGEFLDACARLRPLDLDPVQGRRRAEPEHV